MHKKGSTMNENEKSINDDRFRTVFKKLDALDIDNKKLSKKVEETSKEIAILKAELSGMGALIEEKNHSQTLEIEKLIITTIKTHQESSDNFEISALRDERKWLIRLVIGAVILSILGDRLINLFN